MNLKSFFLSGVFLCLYALVSEAQTPKIQFEEYDLDNGLHVILHEDHSTPIVAVSVMYHVGSKNEDPHLKGFAHLFEHLMFEGSQNIARGKYTEYVEKAGGTLNASTSNDRTYYYEILPSNQLGLGLWLESERMLHARIDSQGIVTQKKVVIEEKKQRYDNRPYGSVLIETMKRAYEKHPYRWTTIGDTSDIRAASHEDVRNFYETFYVPNNAVLTVAGDIQPKEAKKLIHKYFSAIPGGSKEIPRPDVVEPIKHKEIRDTVFDNIRVPAIIQTYHIPAMGAKDYYAVDMLTMLLSEGQSSRLYKSLVDEKQMALQVALFPLPLEDPGVAIMFAMPNMGVNTQKLEQAMDHEIAKVRNQLISERELQKLKNQFETQITRQNNTIASRAQHLARSYTYFNDTDRINHLLDKYLDVTREDLQRVANKYFREDNRVVLYYLPQTQ